MIEGIAASSSTAVPSGRFSKTGHISVRKIAMPKLTGTPINQRNRRGDKRAVDGRQRTELPVDRIPDVGEKESYAELRMEDAADPRCDNSQQHCEHEEGEEAREHPKDQVVRCIFDCFGSGILAKATSLPRHGAIIPGWHPRASPYGCRVTWHLRRCEIYEAGGGWSAFRSASLTAALVDPAIATGCGARVRTRSLSSSPCRRHP